MLNPNLDEIQLSQEEYERFSRHLILPEVGLEGQKRLKAASVLCIGTGGLGAPLLLYLAAAGIGRIGIVDFDIVDRSNLQRQVIHGTSWVGKPKIESAKERILEINPHCQVDLYETRLSSENALEILKPYDIVADGTDNFPTRYLVNDACVLLDKPNVLFSDLKDKRLYLTIRVVLTTAIYIPNPHHLGWFLPALKVGYWECCVASLAQFKQQKLSKSFWVKERL
jgi:sulfur-carrier protein adenylyltransferase/sulfurtransferase